MMNSNFDNKYFQIVNTFLYNNNKCYYSRNHAIQGVPNLCDRADFTMKY